MVQGSKMTGAANGIVAVNGTNILMDDFCKENLDLEASHEDMRSPSSQKTSTVNSEFDPWALPELVDDSVPWKELSGGEKVSRVCIGIGKCFCLLLLLYFFVCSLDFLSSSFRLMVGKNASDLFSNASVLKNPVVGLMLGVIGTVAVQSSSTSTSIIITMVGAGLIEVKNAIPIVMGANIGTSVTNTFVSYGQVVDRNCFRRAFAAATVHDMFNWLAVIVLLPIEVLTGYLEYASESIISSGDWEQNKGLNKAFLSLITKPFTSLIVQLDSKVLEKIAVKNVTDDDLSILKNCTGKCGYLLQYFNMGDFFAGLLMLFIAIIMLMLCLGMIVKLLKSVLKGHIASVIKKIVNAEPRFPFNYFIGYIAMLIGCGMTILVQSSSIFTSALTPLAGIGVISIERMYPLTLGSNIGTTTTGILAAFASNPKRLKYSMQIAFCHLLFNLSGVALYFPIPFMRFPIPLAKKLGNISAKYRWFSVFYLLVMFLLLPIFIFGLSLGGGIVFMAVVIPLSCLIVLIVIINILQSKRPSLLPRFLRNWDWLPECLHSLDPLDRIITKMCKVCVCCKRCKCLGLETVHSEQTLEAGRSQSKSDILNSRNSSFVETIQPNCEENIAFEWSPKPENTSTNL